MSEPTTLIVKHLPSELSFEDREELLKLFGAVKVHCMPDDLKMKYTAFATFPTYEDAKYALSKLHQLEILNRRLVVEIAKKHQNDFSKESEIPKPKAKQTEETVPKISEKENLRLEMEEFSRNLHGVAPTIGLDYLPSPLLKYKYPPPTPTIIANIAHALAAVPKFYTQVLHLMNKMNLPAPFGPVTPTPPLAPDLPTMPFTNNQFANDDDAQVDEMELTASSEESELESEDDIEHRKPDVILPVKRPAEKQTKKHKKPKLQHLLSTTLATSSVASTMSRAEPSDVFEAHSQVESQKKILFNIKPSLEPERTSELHNTKHKEQSGFGVIIAPKAPDNTNDLGKEPGEDIWKNSKFITLDEMRRKRISQREMKTLSVFRNFSPGEPTVRLYIKNLARQVEEKDLRYIFGRFINRNCETERNMFDIRLMKDGRMKGQAFVTLADEKQAIEAVKEANGFVLHTKPLVVQFARSAKPKETPNKTQTKKP